MQTVTVGTKNQIVIPKEIRKKLTAIRPGAKLSVYLRGDEVVVKAETKDWVKSTYGIMKEAWKDIDPIKELEKMRNEW
jgi:AbrB family looped-hinge helix DNA binding protein